MKENYVETLESYLIPAEEGLFSNLKEKRDIKRAEKAKKKAEKAERERLFKITCKEDLQLAKRLCVYIPRTKVHFCPVPSAFVRWMWSRRL